MKDRVYFTTTLPYVNAEPHIGFAVEILQADTLVRHAKSQGKEVFFNTGTDEHGQKIFEAAEKAGKDVQEYVDFYANRFRELKEVLGLSDDLVFIRTTEERHKKAAVEMWNRCKAKGDIYEKEFEGLYCVGCEKFLTEREIVDGFCHIHKTAPRLLKEKNWFFRFSRYADELLRYLEKSTVVVPEWRKEEAMQFIKEGLEDFSISRDKQRLSWGVPVPGDESQVMYVWFDALTNYISTLGWPDDPQGMFKKFWEEGHTIQFAGKDQVRFQSLMWQAMLMSAGVKNTDQVFYHGFINSGGQKMSKSLGNVISPFELVERYGTEATRYLLLRHVHPTEDTDVTWERLDEWYNADLANGLGNLVSRIMTLSEQHAVTAISPHQTSSETIKKAVDSFEFGEALNHVWSHIQRVDRKIAENEPYKVIKSDQAIGKGMIQELVTEIKLIAEELKPFMPETSKKILQTIEANKKPAILFARKE